HSRGRESECPDHAGRHHQDLVARAGQVVGAGAVRRRPRDDSLARFSQRSYQLAHVLERRHRHPGWAQVKDDALDPPVAGDPVEAFAELLDAQPRPSGEALPERSRRIWQRWKVFLEDEHDEVGRPADRAADARDQPPQIAERIENHARPSGRSLLAAPPAATPPPPHEWGGATLRSRSATTDRERIKNHARPSGRSLLAAPPAAAPSPPQAAVLPHCVGKTHLPMNGEEQPYARDQPPQIAERKENHARPSGRSLLCVRGQPHPRRKRRYFPTAWGRQALLSTRRPLISTDARPCLRSASTLRTPVPRDGGKAHP